MIKKYHGRAQRFYLCRNFSAFCRLRKNFKHMNHYIVFDIRLQPQNPKQALKIQLSGIDQLDSQTPEKSGIKKHLKRYEEFKIT